MAIYTPEIKSRVIDMKKGLVRKIKVLLAIMTVISMAFSYTPIHASNSDYVLINDKVKVYAGQNWEDPVTGEYFRWISPAQSKLAGSKKATSSIKYFSFQIRHSIESASFNMPKTKVYVSTSAFIGMQDGTWMRTGTGIPYTVSLRKSSGIMNKTLNFKIGGTTSGSISGLTSGVNYKVRIAVQTDLSYYKGVPEYLCGEGNIS